jgi:hypothetical protein
LRGWVCACGVSLTLTGNHGEAQGRCEACGAEYIRRGECVEALAARGAKA